MSKGNFKRKAVLALAKAVIAAMPRSYFTTQEDASCFMLKGDEQFSSKEGKCFTCGFARADLTPEDVDSGEYYIAGYDSNNPAQGVLDPMCANAVFLDDNTDRGGIIICSVDCVGMSRKDINDIRRGVLESGVVPPVKSINICCTHTHSAIDTQGLWGKSVTKTGRDEAFMRMLKSLTVKAITEACRNARDGELFYTVEKTEGLQYDCRAPETYDKNLTRLHFKPFSGNEDIFIVNFASHAELMGSKTKLVSADFPAYLVKEIEDKNPGSHAMFLNGAIGGMISAREIKKVYRHEIDCEQYTKDFGKILGEKVNSMADAIKISPIINVKSEAVNVVAENFVLILARLMKVLNNDICRTDKRSVACVISEVGYLELGKEEIGVFLIPGELFPELFTNEFLDESTSAAGTRADYVPLKNMGNAKHKFVVGLCNDELGYIIPENDFYLNEELPYINSAHDKFDRKHYEETNSTGPKTAKTIEEAMMKIIGEKK